MATLPTWAPATAYAKGSTVRTVAAQASAPVPIYNGGFEAGDTGWTKDAGWAISTGDGYEGSYKAIYTGAGSGTIKTSGTYPATAGQVIRASVKAKVLDGDDGATAVLLWYNSANVLIETSTGLESSVETGAWMQLQVTGTGPDDAAYVTFAVEATRSVGASVTIDDARWDYTAPLEAHRTAYRAVQDAVGVSGVVEPTWPTILGARVTDGTVIWEVVELDWIEWTANPIIESGLTEPNWPTTVGAFVRDGTANWECVSRRVEDEKCPQSKVVAILASKVFAADRDIIRFSATANPLDWSSDNDAGFLPSGLQQANAGDISVMYPYRANLACWNPHCFQMWQVDPDPSQMALLDQMDGVGSAHPLAACAVGNELYYLANAGIRSVGIAQAAQNMQAGDVGMPIDVLVQAAMVQAAIDGQKAISTYWPGMGQYWLCFGDDGETAGAGGALALACPTNISAIVGEAYSYTYVATGGTAPYTFSVVSGALPPGLTLNASTGVLSGTITTAGSYSFGVQVEDALGVVAFCGWAAAVLEDEAEITDPWRWLGTGQTGPGTRASIRPMKTDMVWAGVADTEIISTNTTSSRSIKRLGDYMVANLAGSECRIALVSDIETWTAGPTMGSSIDAGGNSCVVDGRLYVACRWSGLAYIDSALDAAFTFDTGMLSLIPGWKNGVAGVTGNGSNLLVVDHYGVFYHKTGGGSWATGADTTLSADYGAMDSNGSRVVLAGRNGNPLAACYTDDNGATFTAVTIPALADTYPCQTKHVGNGVWLIACALSSGTAAANASLFKSTNNGATFTAVTLPVGLDLDTQYQQTIAVDGISGRVVIVGTDATSAFRYFYSDDLIVWTEISRTGTDVTGITEVNPLGTVP